MRKDSTTARIGAAPRLDGGPWNGLRIATMVLIALALAYMVFGRPWHLAWGATASEVIRRLPGDDRVLAPDLDATRAVSIQAPAERVWAVVRQNAKWAAACRAPGTGTWYDENEPGRSLVLWDATNRCSASWQLRAETGGGTRLILRQRARYDWRSPQVVWSLLAEPLDALGVHRALSAIKRAAEKGPPGDHPVLSPR